MSTAQKTPLVVSLQKSMLNRVEDSLENLGQVLPCSVTEVTGAIVTVNFEINNSTFTPPPVTCATIGSQYIRVPIKKGDKGICISATARLGGITGLGLGLAPLISPSNLGGLVFVPIGNINWDTVDANAVVISAPNGASVATDDGNTVVIISENHVSLTYGSNSVTIDSSGISINGTLTINGTPFLEHMHTGVMTGGGITGGVVP